MQPIFRGSLKDLNGRAVTVPDHGKDTLKRGLLNGILNELNIPVEDLVNFLDKR